MPIFEYRCSDCDRMHEVIVLPSEAPPESCPDCGGRLERRWSRVGTSFRGWGFARTDALLPDSPRRKSFRQVSEKASELFD
jgi:putative FmdB family regulatory protein